MGVLASVTVLLAISLAVSATPAGAHATFVGGLTTFPVNTQQNLVLSVPHERSDEYWNTEVIIAMPTSWNATSCATKATWTCTMGTEDGFQVVHFTKSAGAGPAEDETFRFTAKTAPTVGSFSFPTIQVYSDGVEAAWIGATGSEEPAPVLKTVAAGTVTTTTPPTTNPHVGTPTTTRPTVTPTTPTPTSPGGPTGPSDPGGPDTPTPTGTPGTLSPGANTFASTTTLPGATTTTTTEPGATTTTTDKDDNDDKGDDDKDDDERNAEEAEANDTSDGAEVSLTGGDGSGESAAGTSADSDGGGGSALPIVLGLGVLAAAGAGGYVLFRRQQGGAGAGGSTPEG